MASLFSGKALWIVFGLLIAVIVAGVFLLPKISGTQGTGHKGDTLPIGVMMPLTGDASAYGIPITDTYKFTADEINAAGGIGGKQIEIIAEDDKCEPASGSTAAQKLVTSHQVKIIFGGGCSGSTLAASPITEGGKIILFSPAATSPKVSAAGDFVFRFAPSDANAGRIAAETAHDAGYKKIAVITETTDYSLNLGEVFTATFKSKGGQIAASETFTPETVNFAELAAKVKKAGPDAVYIVPQAPPKGVLLIKELHNQGVNVPIYTAEILIGDAIAAENAETLEGIIGFETFVNLSAPATAEFASRYTEKTGKELSFPVYQTATYDSLYVIKEAIEANNGVLDTEQIRDYLYGLKDWEGVQGKYTIDSNGDPLVTYAIKKVEGGKSVIIGTAK